MSKLVYLVPLFPFIGFLLNGLLRKKLSKSLISIIGCGTVLGSFVVSLLIFFEVKDPAFQTVVVNLLIYINCVGSLKNPVCHFRSISFLFLFFIDNNRCWFSYSSVFNILYAR